MGRVRKKVRGREHERRFSDSTATTSFVADSDPDNGQDLGNDDGSVLNLPLSTEECEGRSATHTTQ